MKIPARFAFLLVASCLIAETVYAQELTHARRLEKAKIDAGTYHYDVELLWAEPYDNSAPLLLSVKEAAGRAQYFRIDGHSSDGAPKQWAPYLNAITVANQTLLRIRLLHLGQGNVGQELLLVRLHPDGPPELLLDASANLSAYAGNRCNFDRQARIGVVQAGSAVEDSVLSLIVGPHPDLSKRKTRCNSDEDAYNNSQTTATKLIFKDGCFRDEDWLANKTSSRAGFAPTTRPCKPVNQTAQTGRASAENVFVPIPHGSVKMP